MSRRVVVTPKSLGRASVSVDGRKIGGVKRESPTAGAWFATDGLFHDEGLTRTRRDTSVLGPFDTRTAAVGALVEAVEGRPESSWRWDR